MAWVPQGEGVHPVQVSDPFRVFGCAEPSGLALSRLSMQGKNGFAISRCGEGVVRVFRTEGAMVVDFAVHDQDRAVLSVHRLCA